MKYDNLYYLIDKNGFSLFSLPYDIDFLTHCLICLSSSVDTSSFRFLPSSSLSVFHNLVASTVIAETSFMLKL